MKYKTNKKRHKRHTCFNHINENTNISSVQSKEPFLRFHALTFFSAFCLVQIKCDSSVALLDRIFDHYGVPRLNVCNNSVFAFTALRCTWPANIILLLILSFILSCTFQPWNSTHTLEIECAFYGLQLNHKLNTAKSLVTSENNMHAFIYRVRLILNYWVLWPDIDFPRNKSQLIS